MVRHLETSQLSAPGFGHRLAAIASPVMPPPDVRTPDPVSDFRSPVRARLARAGLRVSALAAPRTASGGPAGTLASHPATSGASRFRRLQKNRADARGRRPCRPDPRGQLDSCGRTDPAHERGRTAGCGCGRGPGGRSHLRGGVVPSPRAATPMGAGGTNRRTPGETGTRRHVVGCRRGFGADTKAAPPSGETAKRAIRADSGEVRLYDGRGFDSRRLHHPERPHLCPRGGGGAASFAPQRAQP